MDSGYWIYGKTSVIDDLNLEAVLNQSHTDEVSCLTMGITNNASSPIEIKSKDCKLKRSVMCMLDVPKVPILSTPIIPPKFPCISSEQEVKNKSKREVESVMKKRHNKPKDGECKRNYEKLEQTIFLKCIILIKFLVCHSCTIEKFDL